MFSTFYLSNLTALLAPSPEYSTARQPGTSSLPEMDYKGATYLIDPWGDMVIALGESRFLVSSSQLRLASPVYQAMLSGPWTEGQVPDRFSRYKVKASE